MENFVSNQNQKAWATINFNITNIITDVNLLNQIQEEFESHYNLNFYNFINELNPVFEDLMLKTNDELILITTKIESIIKYFKSNKLISTIKSFNILLDYLNTQKDLLNLVMKENASQSKHSLFIKELHNIEKKLNLRFNITEILF